MELDPPERTDPAFLNREGMAIKGIGESYAADELCKNVHFHAFQCCAESREKIGSIEKKILLLILKIRMITNEWRRDHSTTTFMHGIVFCRNYL